MAGLAESDGGLQAGMDCVWVADKTVDPLVTHGPYLSALQIKGLCIKRYINSSVYFTAVFMTMHVCLCGPGERWWQPTI